MKVTHTIYAYFSKSYKDEHIANHLIWCPVEGKFIPDTKAQDENIDHADFPAEYTKALAEWESSPAKDQLTIKVETTLFLPVPEELESLLDNKVASICTIPE